MRGMRKLESEHIAPERQRPLQVRYRDAGVVSGDDTKLLIHRAVGSCRSVSPQMNTDETQMKISTVLICENLCKSVADCYPIAAMTLSSIAIGVGSAPTSIVVRVGFGLPEPAKYSP